MRAGMLETVDHVEVGCSLWRRRAPESDAPPVGGTVVAIDTVAREETGESMRRFAVLRRDAANQLRRLWLDADEIDVESLQGPNPLTVRDLWRTLCGEVYRRKGTPTPDEGDYIRMAERLYEALSVR
jgi:hypothetical protein